MIRPFTLVSILLAVGAGLFLYRTKHQAQVLDREIQQILRTADELRTRIGLLQADYALLNDPMRLQELAEQHLALKPTTPGQFTTVADLERRLPPIGPAPREPEPEPPLAAAPSAEPVAPAAPRPSIAAAPPVQSPPAAEPVRPAAPARTSVAAVRAPTPLLVPGAGAPPAPAAAPAPVAPPRPPAPLPVQVATPATLATQVTTPGGPPTRAPSALGMARRHVAPLPGVHSGGAEN